MKYLLDMCKYIILYVFCSYPIIVFAETTISAIVPVNQEVSGLTGTLNPGYSNSYLTLSLSPIVDGVTITDIDVQWSPLSGNTTSTGKYVDAERAMWNFDCSTGNCTAKITSVKVTLTNTSGKPYIGSLKQYFVYTWDDVVVTANLGVPGNACSVSVDELPKLPDLHLGQSVNEVRLTSSGTGSGALFFKPSAYDGNKGKIMHSDGSAITYSVTGTTWDAAKGGWTGDLSDHLLKLDDIATTMPVGSYTGTLSVQITCQ